MQDNFSNPTIEKGVLGAIISNENFIGVIFERYGNIEDCFTKFDYKNIYQLTFEMYEEKGKINCDDLSFKLLSKNVSKELISGAYGDRTLDLKFVEELIELKNKREIKDKMRITTELFETNEGEEFRKNLTELYEKCILGAGLVYDKKPLSTIIEERYKQYREYKGELLGYKITGFEEITRKIDGLQYGLYILCAQTNVGKTSFMCNLMMGLLSTAYCLYITLDDDKFIVINRLVAIESGIEINKIQRYNENKETVEKIDNAFKNIISCSQSILDIKDITEIPNLESLKLEITKKYSKHKNLIVFIDGLYNLEVENKYSNIREMNIERANALKMLVDKFKIPIIATGELKKEAEKDTKKEPDIGDIMETGKYAYNSNLLWLLYEAHDDKPINNQEKILTLRFAKNKLTSYKGIIKLKYTPNISKMIEIDYKDSIDNNNNHKTTIDVNGNQIPNDFLNSKKNKKKEE